MEREKRRKQCSFTENMIVIGFIGRLCTQKNVLFLPEILLELQKLSVKYRMLIVGDGDLRKELESKFVDLSVGDYVFFTGIQYNSSDWYNAMDAFCLPSRFEGLPLVGIEAQAYNLPCFISDNVAEEMNITGTVDFIPTEAASDVWARRIHSKMIGERKDRGVFPDEYKIDHAVKNLENRYRELLQEAKAGKE